MSKNTQTDDSRTVIEAAYNAADSVRALIRGTEIDFTQPSHRSRAIIHFQRMTLHFLIDAIQAFHVNAIMGIPAVSAFVLYRSALEAIGLYFHVLVCEDEKKIENWQDKEWMGAGMGLLCGACEPANMKSIGEYCYAKFKEIKGHIQHTDEYFKFKAFLNGCVHSSPKEIKMLFMVDRGLTVKLQSTITAYAALNLMFFIAGRMIEDACHPSRKDEYHNEMEKLHNSLVQSLKRAGVGVTAMDRHGPDVRSLT